MKEERPCGTDLNGLLSNDGVLCPGVRRAARHACHQPVPAPPAPAAGRLPLQNGQRRGASVDGDGGHGNGMTTTDEVDVEALPHQTTGWRTWCWTRRTLAR